LARRPEPPGSPLGAAGLSSQATHAAQAIAANTRHAADRVAIRPL
jgi:hypothetical protein